MIKENYPNDVKTTQNGCRKKAHDCLAKKIVREGINCEKEDFYMKPHFIPIRKEKDIKPKLYP